MHRKEEEEEEEEEEELDEGKGMSYEALRSLTSKQLRENVK